MGFDVGIKEPPLCTYTFPKPPLFTAQLLVHQKIHSRRTSSWMLLRRLPARDTQIHNWAFLHFTAGFGSHAPLRQPPAAPRHVILNFPWDDPLIRSVSADVNSDNFPTAWGTFESTSDPILTLPEGCLAATFDISAAYHLTPICPDQQNSLCLLWAGKVYVDCAVMFGLSSSTGEFGAIADMLVDIYMCAGFGAI